MSEEDLLKKVKAGLNEEGLKKIRAAQDFAKKHLSIALRKEEQNYYEHGLYLASILREVSDDPTLIVVLMLHDLLVLKNGRELLKEAPVVGDEIVLLKRMNELRKLRISREISHLNLVIDSFSSDARLLLLRIVHRLGDVRTIEKFDAQMKREIACETLHLYTAIAGRLGMNYFRHEMEDICFEIVHPEIAEKLKTQFDSLYPLDISCLKQTRDYLKKSFQAEGLEARLNCRIKSLYSTYKKMLLKNREFDDLTDRLALRIIVRSDEDCYKALFLVHKIMKPIPGKLKDYIGAPKENGYQSIHTVVYPLPGVSLQPIEIQIRSEEMHELCKFGAAAHYGYKDYQYALSTQRSRVSIFKNLEVLKNETKSVDQFKNALRTYFQDDHMVIFDEKNNLFHLKKPASVLDYVFLVYGDKACKIEKVYLNGREGFLDMLLRDGDTVEVFFGKTDVFDREWRNICHHRNSRNIVRRIERKRLSRGGKV